MGLFRPNLVWTLGLCESYIFSWLMFTEGGHYHPHLDLPHGEGGATKTAPVALNLFPHPSYKLGSLNFLFNTAL